MVLLKQLFSKKGAYFFVLDAFIAGIIVVSTLAILFGATAIPEDPRQNYLLAEDFMSFLETTTLVSYPTPVRFELQADGNITDLSKSVLEAIVELYVAHNNSYDGEDGPDSDPAPPATRLLEELSARKPDNSGLAFFIRPPLESGDVGTDMILLYRSTTPPQEQANVQLVTQRIVLDDNLDPYFVEVRIWR